MILILLRLFHLIIGDIMIGPGTCTFLKIFLNPLAHANIITRQSILV